MASEYYKWLARDVKPEEKRELTRAEKWKNWWYYYKNHVIIGLVLIGIAVSILCHALGVGQVKPDYCIAYVGTTALSEETAASLQETFAELGRDENGDGAVTVQINQYVKYSTGDSDTMYFAQAAETMLIGDIDSCDSYFFLLEDVEEFQAEMRVLCNLDGSLPSDTDDSPEGKYVLVSDCPALAELSEELGDLALARRGFWTEKTTKYAEGCALLWDSLTSR